MSTRFLALVGSPNPKGTSQRLAHYLADGMTARGGSARVINLTQAVRHAARWPELIEAYADADEIALVAPLYVDALPAEMTLALERLVTERTAARGLFAFMQCGFLEAEQNDTGLAICRLFARDAGLHWRGALALGGGGAMNGQPLKPHGPLVNPLRAMELTLDAVAAGQDLPPEAIALMRRPLMPRWLYMAFANLGMLDGARRHGNLFRVNARPYVTS